MGWPGRLDACKRGNLGKRKSFARYSIYDQGASQGMMRGIHVNNQERCKHLLRGCQYSILHTNRSQLRKTSCSETCIRWLGRACSSIRMEMSELHRDINVHTLVASKCTFQIFVTFLEGLSVLLKVLI